MQGYDLLQQLSDSRLQSELYHVSEGVFVHLHVVIMNAYVSFSDHQH